MDLNEIKRAISDLPDPERRKFLESITPRFVKLAPDEKARLKEKFEAVPENEWIDWEDLKAENPL